MYLLLMAHLLTVHQAEAASLSMFLSQGSMMILQQGPDEACDSTYAWSLLCVHQPLPCKSNVINALRACRAARYAKGLEIPTCSMTDLGDEQNCYVLVFVSQAREGGKMDCLDAKAGCKAAVRKQAAACPQ